MDLCLQDVTKHEDLELARDRVVEVLARTQASVTPRKLAYVIPNAGVAHFGTVEGLPMQSARAMFDINLYVCRVRAWPMMCVWVSDVRSHATQVFQPQPVCCGAVCHFACCGESNGSFGMVETVRAFLPLLRDHGPGARIIVTGSIAGWAVLPLFGND